MLHTDHRSTESGGSFSARLPIPADSVVDPRIGALGPGLLALEDGTVLDGICFGAPVSGGGDLVANTSYSGYQEIATDPSYAGQVVLMTYPLIGNYGRIAWDDQSGRPWLRGFVVAHATAAVLEPARQLVELLRRWDVPAICGLDTRRLARRLRETGTQRVYISAPNDVDADAAVAAAREVARWEDQDFVGQVSADAPHELGAADGPLIGVVDYGLKTNIVRQLVARGARVRVLPHTVDARVALAPELRGLVLSPGPGDPARLDGPVRLAQAAIDDGRPLLGICLGHQIVGRAAGADTRRLRFGHHGANHPVKDVDSGKVQVTAQNHEVEVVGESLPRESGFVVSQRNLNDGSVEGLRHLTKPIETVQYHPEGSPGPLDALEVFDRFMARVKPA
ncbi:MAG TPA: glutamine-hydrolyzing carbamoyl-phosphate synthase small subunit [Candidatus Limnocylindrales bacterium]